MSLICLLLYHNCRSRSSILNFKSDLFIFTGQSLGNLFRTLQLEVWSKPRETTKLVIPAALYTIQNNLLFVALSNLDAATYQVCFPSFVYQCPLSTSSFYSSFFPVLGYLSAQNSDNRCLLSHYASQALRTHQMALLGYTHGWSSPSTMA